MEHVFSCRTCKIKALYKSTSNITLQLISKLYNNNDRVVRTQVSYLRMMTALKQKSQTNLHCRRSEDPSADPSVPSRCVLMPWWALQTKLQENSWAIKQRRTPIMTVMMHFKRRNDKSINNEKHQKNKCLIARMLMGTIWDNPKWRKKKELHTARWTTKSSIFGQSKGDSTVLKNRNNYFLNLFNHIHVENTFHTQGPIRKLLYRLRLSPNILYIALKQSLRSSRIYSLLVTLLLHVLLCLALPNQML